nr:MAG TPA: hypothetical protein [Caudoviricetes sp.]
MLPFYFLPEKLWCEYRYFNHASVCFKPLFK